MARRRSWLRWISLTVGLLVFAVAGFWLFMFVTAPVLHPNPETIPSVTRMDPSPQWSEPVDRARHIIRAGIAEQNLPGLSVAVGIDGEIVWAEGFGFAALRNSVPVTPDTGSGLEPLPQC